MRKIHRITLQQRRRVMAHRHHLAGDAGGPDAVVQALVALHATDPASVYLSVLARSAATTLTDVAEAMYVRRSLVRWMAMRCTLFVFAREDIPTIQAAVSTDIAATLRRRLISQLERNGSEPPIERDIVRWLADLEAGSKARSPSEARPPARSWRPTNPPCRRASSPARPRSNRTTSRQPC